MRTFVLWCGMLACPVALADSASTHQAAEELVRTMHLGEQMRAMVPALIENFSAMRPQDPKLRQIMQQFFDTWFTAAELEPRIVEIYADTFTEQELKQYVRFYKTPAGQKLLEKSPELSARGMEIGRQIVTEHKADLIKIIEASGVSP
jgi:hypothetical protein